MAVLLWYRFGIPLFRKESESEGKRSARLTRYSLSARSTSGGKRAGEELLLKGLPPVERTDVLAVGIVAVDGHLA